MVAYGTRGLSARPGRVEMTFRWAVLCLGCYRRLDNECGAGEIGGRLFNLAGSSRGDKAAVLNEAKYQARQRQEAAKLGLEADRSLGVPGERGA